LRFKKSSAAISGLKAAVQDGGLGVLDGHDESRSRASDPIDLAYLSRQTLGDEDLKREVLDLFLAQITAAQLELAAADCEERRMLAHRLVGAARAVGAFGLAACAAELEAAPQSAEVAERLPRLMQEVRLFVTPANGLKRDPCS